MNSRNACKFHVAGIGASAGGLEAMLPLFAKIPPTGRIAYVIAQHMAHGGHSELVARLIAREARLPLSVARDGEALEADHIYLLPSGKDGVLRGNTLVLSEPVAEYLSHPSADALLTSIARTHQECAIGIILSGTGSDGLAGCRAIKAAKGLTIAQELSEAKFDGMPEAAISARVIDHVLPVEQIGAFLHQRLVTANTGIPSRSPEVKLASALAERSHDYDDPHVRLPAPETGKPATPSLANVLGDYSHDYDDPVLSNSAYRELAYLLPQILKATGIDFSSYKEETLLRRLEKRKATLGMDSAEAYQALIRRDPEELHTLQHLFLVSLSSFFRDHESFRELERALSSLVSAKPAGEALRAWVPGCASGEEAYTLAIILHGLVKKSAAPHPIEIVATDLNPEALAIAREGKYRGTAFKEMENQLLDKYFIAHGQHYEVKPEIRSCVRFEQRDVLGGAPPGGKLDLVSCRNLLIYMKSNLQDQMISAFHQALVSKGLLFIGQSESLSFHGNSLFVAIDHYHRLFRRRT